MVLALGYNLLMSEGRSLGLFGPRRPDQALHLVILGLTLGSLFIINSWDYPTFTFIVAATILIQGLYPTEERIRIKLLRGLVLVGIVIAVSIIPYIPYLGSFQQSREIRIIADKTTLNEFLTIFGLFVFVLISFTVYRIWETRKDKISPLLITFAIASALIISRRYVFIFLVVVVLIVTYLFFVSLKDKSSAYILLLFAAGIGLGLGGEFFYLNDHFGPPLERMNTIFKIYLQIWISWALASTFSIYLIVKFTIGRRQSYLRWAWTGLLLACMAASLFYTVAATYSRTNRFKNDSSLDGLAALRRSSSPDYQAIAWINSNIEGKPVMLETTGDAYSWNSRVSSFTGLPTVLGWGNHEAGWRNSWDGVLTRTRDVRTIYSTPDLERAKRIMAAYGVEYVYVGPLEHRDYPKEGLDKFSRFMERVYDSNGVEIYRLP